MLPAACAFKSIGLQAQEFVPLAGRHAQGTKSHKAATSTPHHEAAPGTGDNRTISSTPESPEPGHSMTNTSTGATPAKRTGLLEDIIGGLAFITEKYLGDRTAADVMAVRVNGKGDTEAFLGTLCVNLVAVPAALLAFTLFRRTFPLVYASRERESPSAEPQRCCSWFAASMGVTDEQLLEAAGLDGLMLVEFTRLFRHLFFCIGIVFCLVLCPMHYYCGADPEGEDFLLTMGIVRISQCDPDILWVHVIAAWIMVLATLRCVFASHSSFQQWRFKWLQNIPEPRSTTLMVEGIPRQYCSDKALKSFFVHLFSEAAISRAYVVRHTRHLRSLVGKLESARDNLMLAERKWQKAGNEPSQAPKIYRGWCNFLWGGDELDAISYYRDQVEAMEMDVTAERERIEAAVESKDASVCASAGFVTFTSRRWCRLAAREQICEDASKMIMSMPPEPSDVVWKDLEKHMTQRWGLELIASLLVVIVFIMWTPMVVVIGSMMSLESLQEYVPVVQNLCESSPVLKVFFQGLLATLALRILMAMLPTILMRIDQPFAILKSGAWAQLKLQNKFYIFQVIFVVLVTAINVSVQRTVKLILDQPQEFLNIMAGSLPNASHFYLNYIILGLLTTAMQLLRHMVCIKYLFFRTYMDEEEARRRAEPEDQDGSGMGARMAIMGLMATIVLIFCTSMPIIVPCGWLYFSMSRVTYGYLLMFAETKKADLGGAFWIQSIRHIFFALVLYVLLVGGILASQESGRGKYPCVVVFALLLVLWVAWMRLGQFVWDSLPFEVVADRDHELAKRRTDTKGLEDTWKMQRYVQPECVSPAQAWPWEAASTVAKPSSSGVGPSWVHTGVGATVASTAGDETAPGSAPGAAHAAA